MTTIGTVLLLLSVARRRSIPRVVVLVLLTAFAGFQWYFLMSMMKLPDYAGSVQAGKQQSTFRATFVDGRPFTEADLRDGSRRMRHWRRACDRLGPLLTLKDTLGRAGMH